MTEIMQYINGERLEEDYEQYQKTNCENKFLYPFTSPVHVILCLIYTGLVFSFVLCFGIEFPSLTGNMSGVWIIFCVVATMYGTLVNVYAFSVAGLYVMIFVGILLIIATVLVLCCFLQFVFQAQTTIVEIIKINSFFDFFFYC